MLPWCLRLKERVSIPNLGPQPFLAKAVVYEAQGGEDRFPAGAKSPLK